VTVVFPFCASAVFGQTTGNTNNSLRDTLKPMNTSRVLLLASAALLAFSAHAAELAPGGVFVQGGGGENGTYAVSAGLVWPWSWRREARNGVVTGITEAYVSHWNARGSDGRRSFTQLGLTPMFRYRGDHGRSPWFVEAGIGISVIDPVYTTDEKQFSTRFNFVDIAGVGRSFGPQGQRELSLRLSHVSNGGIKRPNPGENFLQLRYAVLF
jgi:lipid A 3-O-deacylase